MLILHNGTIHTLDEKKPIAHAIAIESGTIRFVSRDDSLATQATPADQVIDLQGQCVLPGLTDAHIHLEHYAYSLALVDCETPTRAECIARVRQRASITPTGDWVRGHGWNQNLWAEGFGCAADLDAAAPHNPVFLTAKSLHAAWANTTALQRAGVTAATPDPEGGTIQRDASGQPTGILLESAVDLIYAVLPTPTVEEVCQNILIAQRSLWQMGITSVHDFDRQRCFQALQILHQRNQLGLRVLKSIPVEELPAAVALGLRGGFGDDTLRIGSVKCFADGALGPQTAAMLEPFTGSSNLGMLLLTAEQVFEIGKTAAQVGLSLAVHAIGDHANRQVLDGFARLRDYESKHHLPALRHRIEHVQLLAPNDLDRLAQFAIIASVQPIHATSDMRMADQYWGSRSAYAYAYNALLHSGANLAFGSDAPVESPNPFWGLHAAVARQDRNGEPSPSGWYPQQRLSLLSALHGFTLGPAYAAGWENHLGALKPGFYADLIILPQDPFHLPPQELHLVKPVATMVAGEWVWKTDKES